MALPRQSSAGERATIVSASLDVADAPIASTLARTARRATPQDSVLTGHHGIEDLRATKRVGAIARPSSNDCRGLPPRGEMWDNAPESLVMPFFIVRQPDRVSFSVELHEGMIV